ncbi:MAG: HNH endonuclease [Methanoregula sp.]|jgi:predicted HNH restriction endonuclease
MPNQALLKKEIIQDTIKIAQDFFNSDVNGKNLNWHKENMSKYVPLHEKLELYKIKFGKTPNVILKNFLDDYLRRKNLTDRFMSEGKPFYTQKVNSFTWACISPKRDKSKLKYPVHSITSQGPQLYILIDENGIEFGFDYGFHVDNNNIQVQSIKSRDQILNNLFELVGIVQDLNIYEDSKPENQNKKIEPQSPFDLKERWSKDIRILHIYSKDNIPYDLDEKITTCFDNLLFVFIFSSLISESSPEEIYEYLKLKGDDTNSFISWTTGEKKKIIPYNEFKKEQDTEEEKARGLSDEELYENAKAANPTPPRKIIMHQIRQRNPNVAEYAKRRAKGKCQLCNLSAPFNNKFGLPYLETHHIDWLSKDGLDAVENTVALCPNCHKKMHVLDLPQDRELLKSISREY